MILASLNSAVLNFNYLIKKKQNTFQSCGHLIFVCLQTSLPYSLIQLLFNECSVSST
jgi:hypothetical protein